MTQREFNDILSPEARKAMLADYYALCDERDAIYAKAAPIEKKLAAACAATEAARVRELEIAKEVEAAWGPGHLERKQKIGRLADLLRFIPAREGVTAPSRP